MQFSYNGQHERGLKFDELKPMTFYKIISIKVQYDSDSAWKVDDLIVTDSMMSTSSIVRAINMRTRTYASEDYANASYREFKAGEKFTVTI